MADYGRNFTSTEVTEEAVMRRLGKPKPDASMRLGSKSGDEPMVGVDDIDPRIFAMLKAWIETSKAKTESAGHIPRGGKSVVRTDGLPSRPPGYGGASTMNPLSIMGGG